MPTCRVNGGLDREGGFELNADVLFGDTSVSLHVFGSSLIFLG